MKIIGVTGGIGSGKSTVATILKNLGAFVIDADKIAKTVTIKGQPALDELVEFFGKGILKEDGELDRAKLSVIVFSDKNKLKKLNEITHKHVITKIIQELNRLKEELKKNNNDGIIVLDVPIPVKHGFLDIVEEVWVVISDKETRIKRVMKRNNISYSQVLRRIEAQKNEDEYLQIASKVIDNSGTLEELESIVKNFYIKRKYG